ncbi:hypothetical protein ES703_29064 [subsurface metagenome]
MADRIRWGFGTESHAQLMNYNYCTDVTKPAAPMELELILPALLMGAEFTATFYTSEAASKEMTINVTDGVDMVTTPEFSGWGVINSSDTLKTILPIFLHFM